MSGPNFDMEAGKAHGAPILAYSRRKGWRVVKWKRNGFVTVPTEFPHEAICWAPLPPEPPQ